MDPEGCPCAGASVGPREPTGTEKQDTDQGAGVNGQLLVEERQETDQFRKILLAESMLRYCKRNTFYLNGGEPQGSERKTNKEWQPRNKENRETNVFQMPNLSRQINLS